MGRALVLAIVVVQAATAGCGSAGSPYSASSTTLPQPSAVDKRLNEIGKEFAKATKEMARLRRESTAFDSEKFDSGKGLSAGRPSQAENQAQFLRALAYITECSRSTQSGPLNVAGLSSDFFEDLRTWFDKLDAGSRALLSDAERNQPPSGKGSVWTLEFSWKQDLSEHDRRERVIALVRTLRTRHDDSPTDVPISHATVVSVVPLTRENSIRYRLQFVLRPLESKGE